MSDDPYDQIEKERLLRWARRDLSIHPLTETEAAERRHYEACAWWDRLLCAPPVAACVLGSIAGGTLDAIGLTIFAMLFLLLVGCLMDVILSWIAWEFTSEGRHALLGAAIKNIIAFTLIFVAGESANIAPALLTPSLVAAMLPFWWVIYRRIRRAHPTDYEKLVMLEAAPVDRLIE